MIYLKVKKNTAIADYPLANILKIVPNFVRMSSKKKKQPAVTRFAGTSNQRQLFFDHLGQTSPSPLALEIEQAKGIYLYDRQGREYTDLISGISVCNVGHCHPKVVEAIRKQAGKYLHLLVYGELIETPQVQYAQLLATLMPPALNTVYFTNSGAEATEGAMKLAKRLTGRTEIAAFHQSYHGSTQGALSILGDEYWRNAFRPLLPGIIHLEYNSNEALEAISTATACVIAETVQAERGVVVPQRDWLKALRKRCTETGTLLVLDEIQTGFGRTGPLWGFEAYDVIPDIVLLGKALGGGMPLGAFVSGRERMNAFTNNPVLGHITTFGGHPVSCAAGHAALQVLLESKLLHKVPEKEMLFRDELQHPRIKQLRTAGLLIALELDSAADVLRLTQWCIEAGLLTDWFLFAPNCLRIAPPLTITKKEIRSVAAIIRKGLDALAG